ncbi:HAD hydrolase-like protein [Bradyrhizobium septentrionale]|uniref:phosphoglycolate phosphatase n=1 Tax=Bradyrhizobium septentrionale TaxID=1404411 RepID=A0A973W4U1_9BRAD|nr:HAD hydrolase-like protein [Bradyrhizobium septentrionale]UGY16311.1 HAD hydrolase-like protein [Bradyrhizobium septentrionale]UGY24939.1 HAD hydrolase-like protein [Bradyrhizobium septentrionale]
MKPVRAILFDLDGTLVQTREASWRVFAKTNAALGLGINSQAEFFRLLEDNMFHGLSKHCGDARKADEAAKHFLNLLQNEYNPDFVPGMADVVRAFAGSCSLAVISSNSVATIRRILEREGLTNCFSHVFGGDVEQDKRACVRRFLSDRSYLVSRNCSPAYQEGHEPDAPRADQIALITDTVGDVKHAVECGVRAIGVSWGMHTEQQLLAAGAEFVAVWPQELVARLLPNGYASSCSISSCAIEEPISAGCVSGCACGCQDGGLADAASLRRRRRMAASAALEQRATGGLDWSSRGADAAAGGAGSVDKVLLASLRRLKSSDPPSLH